MKEFHYKNSNLTEVKNNSTLFDELLSQEWQSAMAKDVFKFRLDDKLPSKHLIGKYNFFIQVILKIS